MLRVIVYFLVCVGFSVKNLTAASIEMKNIVVDIPARASTTTVTVSNDIDSKLEEKLFSKHQELCSEHLATYLTQTTHRGVTQSEIAECFFVSTSTINRFMRERKSQELVCKRFDFYRKNVKLPIYDLKNQVTKYYINHFEKGIYNPRGELNKDALSIMDEIFSKSATMVMLPPQIKKSKFLHDYISQLTLQEDTKAQYLCNLLGIERDKLSLFLTKQDSNTTTEIYTKIRNYYRENKPKISEKLNEIGNRHTSTKYVPPSTEEEDCLGEEVELCPKPGLKARILNIMSGRKEDHSRLY